MNRQKAEQWKKEITELLTDKDLISVSFNGEQNIIVRQNQKFNNCYILERNDGNYFIAINDSCGVRTSAEHWTIEPEKRTIHAKTTNGFNEPVYFSWAISNNDDDGTIWRLMKDTQERLRKL